MSEEKKPPQKSEDKELADLLDSALQDFGDDANAKSEKQSDDGQPKELKKDDKEVPQEWSQEFVQQAALHFEENFAKLLEGGGANVENVVQEKLKQMTDAAEQVLSNPADISDQSVDFASTISQAIAGLTQGQENLKAPINEENLMNMFGGALQGDLLPFMQGMMQGLLSKEVLAPSLQDFVEKLPGYLEKNKGSLSEQDTERYENQRKLMEEVLMELNTEKEDDSVEVKKERFTKVLALMQKLQDYGEPPAELVGEVNAPFTFDPAGNPTLPNPDPAATSECCLM